jgi:hypothetical protein
MASPFSRQPPRLPLAAVVLLTAFVFSPLAGRAQENSSSAKKKIPPCDGGVWCGLFLASGDAAADSDEEALPIVARLQKAFPKYGSFRLIGENSEVIYKEYECWIVPSKKLFLKVDSLGPESEEKEDSVHVHFQLWQEDHVILKSETILRRCPVFIAGPRWGEGQLIMVLKLDCGEAEAE